MGKITKNKKALACSILLIIFILTSIALGLIDAQKPKEGYVFKNFEEIDNIVGIQKVSSEVEFLLEDYYVEEGRTYQYLIKNEPITIKAYVFKENAYARSYFNEIMNETNKNSFGYDTNNVFFITGTYCAYNENLLVYVESKNGFYKVNQFIKVMKENFSVVVMEEWTNLM